ncbi:MAG TPA: AMP-binding protein [bacterium]|nr:AMP-binding protein [bacterium]
MKAKAEHGDQTRMAAETPAPSRRNLEREAGQRRDGSREDTTLPLLLIANAGRWGSRVAVREKEYGIWQAYSWLSYLDNVRAFALGLASLGFGRGDRLAIIGDNRPQLYWAMVAAQALGGVAVPVYQDAIAAEMQYVIHHSDSKVVVAEDQEQVDKILEIKDHLAQVNYILYKDPKGLRHYSYPFLLPLEHIQTLGHEEHARHPGAFEEEVHRGQPSDVATINYTSGTTGLPKGVMLSHRALIATAQNFVAAQPMTERDDLMAYLPMAWIGDTLFSLGVSLVAGTAINCPEEVTTVRQDLREIGPTVIFAPPRIWENVLSQTQVKIEDARWLPRRLTQFALRHSMAATRRRMENKTVPISERLLGALGEPLIFAPLRDRLGLGRVRVALTAGGAIAPEVLQFFRSLGVNLKQLYAMTETAAGGTLQPDDQVKRDSVGLPIPGVRIRISETGEVLISSPGLFSGYYKNPEATAQALRDGWFLTGDAGLMDSDGHLIITDRAKDVSRLQDGSVFAPQYIENKLKFSPHIKEAVTLGHERPFVAAIVNIDIEVVGHWAERRGIAYSGYPDLAQNPRVHELITQEVERTNTTLPPPLRVKRFVVLHKELDPDDAEITRTRKLRRNFIAQKYSPIIEALYAPQAQEVTVKAAITFEDGRTADVERRMRIHDVF